MSQGTVFPGSPCGYMYSYLSLSNEQFQNMLYMFLVAIYQSIITFPEVAWDIWVSICSIQRVHPDYTKAAYWS